MVKYIPSELALDSLCAACEIVPIDEKENCPYRFTGCQEYANIFSLPAADVKPMVRSRWVYDCERTAGDGWTYRQYHCEKCGNRELGGLQNYCPNCGADMREEDNER